VAPLGLFAFHSDRTPHAVGAASGAARKETATRYAARLGGSSRTIRATGRIVKLGACGSTPQHDDPSRGWRLIPLLPCRGVGGVFGW
jgi:hypothetical protein